MCSSDTVMQCQSVYCVDYKFPGAGSSEGIVLTIWELHEQCVRYNFSSGDYFGNMRFSLTHIPHIV